MKRIMRLAVITAFTWLGVMSLTPKTTIVESSNVTVKLVLGKGATLTGYTGAADTTIYHENVVTYTGSSGSALPEPAKSGTEFISWVYAENSELVRVTAMPLTSGAIYFAYYEGDGSLATGISEEDVTLYLNTGGASLWQQASARFYVYTFNESTAGVWPGTELTLVSGSVYSATIPGGFANLIFARVSPDLTSTWNQTGDLSYMSGMNLYTITGWDASDGLWSSYS